MTDVHGVMDGSSQADRQVSAERPWPGLLSFAEGDRDFFFGRDAEADDLLDLVVDHRLTTLYGLSGLGKTSLLNAGLFPRLRQRGFLPVPLRLDLSATAATPSAQILEALVSALRRAGAEATAPAADESIWAYLHRADVVFWSSRHRLLTPVLVFDQFEEIFSRPGRDAAGDERRAPIIDLVGDLAEGRVPAALKASFEREPAFARRFELTEHRYRMLIALREDYLADLDELASEMPSQRRSRMRLGHMRGTTAVAAVLSSSKSTDILTPDVAFAIVKFVGESSIAARHTVSLPHLPIEPALLSVVCRELNEERILRGQPQITIGQLDTSEAILRRFYEAGVEGVPDPLRRFLEERLVTADGMREMVALQTLLGIDGVSEADIERLIERRILRTEYREGRRLLELTHDRLGPVVLESRQARAKRMARPALGPVATSPFSMLLAGLQALGKPQVLDEKFRTLADSGVRLTGASRAIVFAGPRLDVLVERTDGSEPPVPLATVRQRVSAVYESGEAEFADVIGVPLVPPIADDEETASGGAPRGVLYLDSPAPMRRLSENETAAVAAIASEIAAGLASMELHRAAGDRQRLEHELRVAAEIQQQLLPAARHEGPFHSACALIQRSRWVTSDFFDYEPLPDGSFGFVVGDVSGKGSPAAIFAARIQAMLAVQSPSAHSPAELIARVNRALTRRAVEARFATLVYGILAPDGRLTYCNAGHNMPMLVTRDGVRRLSDAAMPIGFFESAPYGDATEMLAPGDLLVVFSDGFPEALNPAGEEFSEPRLESAVRAMHGRDPAEVVETLAGGVREFMGTAPQHDDLMVMAVRYARR